MNAQIWYSHNGPVKTAPAITETFSLAVNPSSTPLYVSTHSDPLCGW
jgi:hypothetical protein